MTTTGTETALAKEIVLAPGDEVIVIDAPSWCRRYLAGRTGRVVRALPFVGGDVWVRFRQPVPPWCERMDPVEEFPFSPEHLATT